MNTNSPRRRQDKPMQDNLPQVITIDGPAASGKSTVGLMLAKRLGYLYLDTGSMYRALTLRALERGVSPQDGAALGQLAVEMDLDVVPAGDATDGRHYTAMLDGRDVTWDIRSPEVDAAVSAVSSHLEVREEMVRRQRAFARRGRVVMVGRDIGTVVCPDAPLKLYITATAEQRARRRWRDRQQQGHADDYEVILADVIRRDKIDSTREHSPLRAAADAVSIDSSERSPESIVETILIMVTGDPSGAKH